MPYQPSDAQRFTKKAAGAPAAAKRQWAAVNNSILKRTGDEGRAIRGANATLADRLMRAARKSRKDK